MAPDPAARNDGQLHQADTGPYVPVRAAPGVVPARVGRVAGDRSGGAVVRLCRRTGGVAGGPREGAAEATRRPGTAVLGGRLSRADRRATRMLGRKCQE